MIRVLITGQGSYIGQALESTLAHDPHHYHTETLDMRTPAWKDHDFSTADVVFHVAGIAHIQETAANRDLYTSINRDLAIETAQRAKSAGVKHFIFLSSMSVYGQETGTIDAHTPLDPQGAYGQSKLDAEIGIQQLQDDSFTVSTLRPPMVYGKGCKGNYPKLVHLALKSPIFPDVRNRRSMIYIENLMAFVRGLIDHRQGGLFFPQNAEYVSTGAMVREIAKAHGKHPFMPRLFNLILRALPVNVIRKAFGDLTYDQALSQVDWDYQVCDFAESIRRSES